MEMCSQKVSYERKYFLRNKHNIWRSNCICKNSYIVFYIVLNDFVYSVVFQMHKRDGF